MLLIDFVAVRSDHNLELLSYGVGRFGGGAWYGLVG